MALSSDPRFDTSGWSAADKNQAGPSRSTSPTPSESGQTDGDQSDAHSEVTGDGDEAEAGLSGVSEDENDAPVVKGLSPKELEAFERKQRKRGIIYISRIPPGMTVPKVRHLLSGFGEVERIFLQDGNKKEREAETGKKQSQRNTRFTEGWVEMSKKSVAKIVAQTLNAQPIGFSSGGRSANKNARRWKDDVWTMKYLPGFKWHMLNEQMAHERASHASRLRTELAQSRFEQQDYLKKVERARVQRDKEERKKARALRSGQQEPQQEPNASNSAVNAPGGKLRTFKQRQPVLRDVRDQRQDGRTSKKRQAGEDGGSTGQGPSKKAVTSSSPSSGASSAALSGVLSKIF